MKKLVYLIVAMVLFPWMESQAQQSRVLSQFFINPFVYNPAYAGVEGHSVFFAAYRKQWSNIDGAPAISHLSFHTPLKGGIAVGGSFFNEQEQFINTTSVRGSASYLLALDRKHYLRFGLSLGFGTRSINTDGFDSPADPAFASLSESATFTLAEFGATYHFGHFNFGVALPNLIGYEIIGSESFSQIRVDPLDEALLKINYRGHVSDDFAFEPHLLYRLDKNLGNQFEAALITHLKHIVWVGASFRQDAGFIALFGTKIKEKIGVGFAYDLGNSNFSDLLGPTLEVHIGYHLGTRKEHAEHVSSFIKSHRLTAEERQAKAEALKLQKEKQIALQNQNDDLEEKEGNKDVEVNKTEVNSPDDNPKNDEVIEKTPEEKRQERADALKNRIKNIRNDSQIKTQDPSKNQNNENSKVSKQPNNQELGLDDNAPIIYIENEVVDHTNDQRSIAQLSRSNVPKKVKKGDNILELETGNYVVAGSFKVFDRAEDFSDQLFEKGYRDVIVGYVTETDLYYTVIFQSKNLKMAKERRKALQVKNGLSKLWLLTVE